MFDPNLFKNKIIVTQRLKLFFFIFFSIKSANESTTCNYSQHNVLISLRYFFHLNIEHLRDDRKFELLD
jgi:hypothetical protein